MIDSFGDAATADLFHGRRSNRTRRFPANIIPGALRKLDIINAANRLDDLRRPPGNRLEALSGKGDGLHSIRINDQWRIIFHWQDGRVRQVRVVDYH